MTTYTKRIQSRLNRMGIKKSLAEIREVYTSVVADKDNPTEEELSAVLESLMTIKKTTELTEELTKVILSSNEEESLQEEELTNNQIQPMEEPQVESDSVTVITNNSTPSTTPPANPSVEKEDYLALLDESQKTTTITQSQKGEIVQKAFSKLGFTATESEVFEIVKAFETTQTAESEFFALVLPLVKEWIKRKTEQRLQKYEQAYQEIAGDVCESLQSIVSAKEKFETNLFTFRETLEAATDNFRDDSRKSISNIQEFFAAK
jgi:hypothetical protein